MHFCVLHSIRFSSFLGSGRLCSCIMSSPRILSTTQYCKITSNSERKHVKLNKLKRLEKKNNIRLKQWLTKIKNKIKVNNNKKQTGQFLCYDIHPQECVTVIHVCPAPTVTFSKYELFMTNTWVVCFSEMGIYN